MAVGLDLNLVAHGGFVSLGGSCYLSVSKNRVPKMDGENNGKPY